MGKKFEAADGIRGVACLIVLILHSVVIFYQGVDGYLTGLPKVGVWLFFVLSAFLLTLKLERDGFSWRVTIAYLVGRFFRIIPLYALFVIVYWYFGTAGINSGEDVLKSLSLSGAYSHLWTIPVEFKYYAILPLVAFFLIWIKGRFGVNASLFAGAAVILLEESVWPYWNTPETRVEMVWFMPCFALGSMAAMCMGETHKFVSGSRASLAAIIVIVGVALSSPYARFKLFGIGPDGYLLNKYVFFSVAWAIFIVFAVEGGGVVGRCLQSWPLSHIGNWSYPIYLVHWLVIVTIATLYQQNALAAAFSVLVSIAAGALIHHFAERPIDSFRHYLMRNIRR